LEQVRKRIMVQLDDPNMPENGLFMDICEYIYIVHYKRLSFLFTVLLLPMMITVMSTTVTSVRLRVV